MLYPCFRDDRGTDENVYDGCMGTLVLFLVLSALAFPNGTSLHLFHQSRFQSFVLLIRIIVRVSIAFWSISKLLCRAIHPTPSCSLEDYLWNVGDISDDTSVYLISNLCRYQEGIVLVGP